MCVCVCEQIKNVYNKDEIKTTTGNISCIIMIMLLINWGLRSDKADSNL